MWWETWPEEHWKACLSLFFSRVVSPSFGFTEFLKLNLKSLKLGGQALPEDSKGQGPDMRQSVRRREAKLKHRHWEVLGFPLESFTWKVRNSSDISNHSNLQTNLYNSSDISNLGWQSPFDSAGKNCIVLIVLKKGWFQPMPLFLNNQVNLEPGIWPKSRGVKVSCTSIGYMERSPALCSHQPRCFFRGLTPSTVGCAGFLLEKNNGQVF